MGRSLNPGFHMIAPPDKPVWNDARRERCAQRTRPIHSALSTPGLSRSVGRACRRPYAGNTGEDVGIPVDAAMRERFRVTVAEGHVSRVEMAIARVKSAAVPRAIGEPGYGVIAVVRLGRGIVGSRLVQVIMRPEVSLLAVDGRDIVRPGPFPGLEVDVAPAYVVVAFLRQQDRVGRGLQGRERGRGWVVVDVPAGIAVTRYAHVDAVLTALVIGERRAVIDAALAIVVVVAAQLAVLDIGVHDIRPLVLVTAAGRSVVEVVRNRESLVVVLHIHHHAETDLLLVG